MYNFDDEEDKSIIVDIFLSKPLTLMQEYKIQYIFEIIRKFDIKNILEVGTFAGGTSYLLAREFGDASVTTIDINKFEEYFTLYDHDLHLEMIKKSYPSVSIDTSSIVKIQQIYNESTSNLTFLEGNWHNIDVSEFDCIIIDGDHHHDQVFSDLKYAYENIKEFGIIIVDDCLYPSIKNAVENYCNSNNLEFSFECHYTISTPDGRSLTGNDLCIIRKGNYYA